MNNNLDMPQCEDEIWARSVVERWRKMGIKLNPPATLKEIIEIEAELNFSFPNSFKELYKLANGFRDWDFTNELMSISPLSKILKDYKEDEDEDFIPFCDHSINLFWIGFLKSESGVFLSSYTVEPLALTYKEAIELINTGDRRLFEN
ncbi:SMI1/KNR4 family protein [Flavobacterium ajazii]|uniref:SMI1/KNR4 family protein n=1 Tax=Flavobacterium ajazii TaxID=2692318 RepID=UPI0013D7C059|nr:SMI1/KNR4 family protein [Flavobacterium ajazii]